MHCTSARRRPSAIEERGPRVHEEDCEDDRRLEAQYRGGGGELLAAEEHDDRARGDDHRERQQPADDKRQLRGVLEHVAQARRSSRAATVATGRITPMTSIARPPIISIIRDEVTNRPVSYSEVSSDAMTISIRM